MKTVLITGANKGIGFEAAKQLAGAGYYVYLGCRDKDKGAEAVSRLKAGGYNHIELVVIDISNAQSVTLAAETLSQKIPSLDVLINNAGISGGLPQPPPSSVSVDIIKAVFETNVFGTIRTIQAFLPLLKKSGAPRIVNVTSDLASLTKHNDPTWPYYNFKGGAYGPSKTALNAYTVALAFELLYTPFKINAVNPGYTATDFNSNRGTKNVADAAAIIVEYAMLNADGPTGKFMSDYGETPW